MAGLSFLRVFSPAALCAGFVLCSLTVVPVVAQGASATQADDAAAQAATAASQFAAFKRDFRATALADGIAPDVYDRAMATAHLRPTVIRSNTQQPEFVKPIWSYLDSAVSRYRVQHGRRKMAEYPHTLRRISARYGVPAEVLVAIWGLESLYGKMTGSHPMFSALASLAYDGPRATYARRQLLAALHMMQDQHLSPETMKSSWAGAFGQTQFVPTTYLSYAVDGNGDGKIDLWNSVSDALASTANLLKHKGWQNGARWGREVVLPDTFPWQEADLSVKKPLDSWRALGVEPQRGHKLYGTEPASVLLPAGADGPAFVVGQNFRAILHYNHATAYALGVSLLSDRLAHHEGVIAPWPRSLQPLTHDDVIAMQNALNALGFNAGKPDGLIGPGTRAAIRGWQSAHGLRADGFATQGLLTKIKADAGM